MKVAFGSDERTTLTEDVEKELRNRGHEVISKDIDQWPDVSHTVARAVANGEAETAVLFCWTGTGASMAANKVPGVRAALCTDAPTAEGARRWNDANVLVMSLRLTSLPVAIQMLDAWFEGRPDPSETENIARVEEV